MQSEIVSKKFVTSAAEIGRRKRAFTTLIVSFFLVFCIFLYDLFLLIPAIALVGSITLALMLLLFLILTVKLLNKQRCLVINISEGMLKRQFDGVEECYDLNDVNTVRIKRTVKKNIREILIWFNQGKRVAVNGLDTMDEFCNELMANSPNSVAVKNVKEYVEYDHPLFYLVLGVLTGGAGALLLRLMKDITAAGLQYLDFTVAFLTITTGVIFVLVKPITSRYGRKIVNADYIWGFPMLFVGVYLFVKIWIG